MGQWFIESLLAARLGVTRNELEGFRSHLKKETDWKKENRQVLLSDSSVKKILVRLGSPDFDYSDCAQKNGDEPPPPEILELTVTRVFPNPRVIEASLDTGRLVRVSVMNSTNFRPKMIIKARLPWPGGPELYRLEGRCPRFPGRW
jgi:hypothetical protein